jgi:hypothetical protein
VGSGWLQVARSEAATCTHGGGGLANREGRRGAADVVQTRLTGGDRMSRRPSVSGGCGRERGQRGSAAAGWQQAGPGHTVPGAV